MFKKSFIVVTFAFVLILGILYQYLHKSEKDPRPTLVAITQIAPHPSLDHIRKGIMDVLKEGGIHTDQITFQNAQGSPATALQIAQKFVSLRPKVIIPITTPSAQAALSAAKAAGIPVIFSAVNDPALAKLVDESMTSDFAAGVSDFPPIAEQIQLIEDLFGANISVGVLYNAGEVNSVSVVSKFTTLAKEHGMQIFTAPASNTNDVGTAAKSLIARGVKVIYIPNDNTVISALESVLHAAATTKTPVITSDPESVERGALASMAHSQYQIGRETGRLVLDLLDNKKSLKEIGVHRAKETLLSLNMSVAKKSHIVIPETLQKKAKYIILPQQN